MLKVKLTPDKGELQGLEIYLNPSHIMAITPLVDKESKAVLLGQCRVLLPGQPPLGVSEDKDSFAARVNMAGSGIVNLGGKPS